MTLQGGRDIAAFMVLLYHANGAFGFGGRQTLGHFFSFGFAGLDYFFVLSGFIIAWSSPAICRVHAVAFKAFGLRLPYYSSNKAFSPAILPQGFPVRGGKYGQVPGSGVCVCSAKQKHNLLSLFSPQGLCF